MASTLAVDKLETVNEDHITLPKINTSAGFTSASKFPPGHIIQRKTLVWMNGNSNHVKTNNSWNTFTTIGSNGSVDGYDFFGFVNPIMSSQGSYLRFINYSNMMHTQGSISGEFTITIQNAPVNNSHDNDDDMLGTSTYKNYVSTNGGYHSYTNYMQTGTENDTTGNVANLNSWYAGEALYWRVFLKKSSTDSNNFYYYHANSQLGLWFEEIAV